MSSNIESAFLLDRMVDTTLELLPKTKNPTTMKDLRPMSLCKVSYKIISKILAYRLKHLLPSLTSPAQSAFIPRRLITDNYLLAFEMMHFLKRKAQGQVGYFAMKIDILKAYDRVDWNYLSRVFEKMSFNDHWIKLLMMCVENVRYEIFADQEFEAYFSEAWSSLRLPAITLLVFIMCRRLLSFAKKQD